MATALRWKVYRGDECVALCLKPEDAAILVAAFGPGSTIRRNTRIVWREGFEAFSAGDSYDEVARVCEERHRAQIAWLHNPRYRQPRPPQATGQ